VCAFLRSRRRPATPREWARLLRHSAGVCERAAEQKLDLGVEAAQLVCCPARERVVHSRVDAKEDRLALTTHE
jgi:hypothetical protein